MGTRRLAIFDVDGTIVRWNLIFELFDELVKRKLFPSEALEQTMDAYLGWVNREKDFSEYDMLVSGIFHKYSRGMSEEAANAIADDIIENKRYRIYRYTSNLIKRLKLEGYYVVFISGSPSFIVKRLAKKLECDRAYGKLFEVVDGKFTGNAKFGEENVTEKDILDKTLLFNRLLHVISFTPDLANSVVVGDSMNDVSLLNLVGNPIVFNPTSELAELAREKQWKIVVERKDVIYEIKDFEMINVGNL